MIRRVVILPALAIGAQALGAQAQVPPSAAARQDTLGAVVVTAERGPVSLTSTSAAVTRISGERLRAMPAATLADVIRLAPGLALVDTDGLGRDPQLMARGFYGGGEAEYVVVTIDGQPVSRLESGLVAWDALPPLESIEAVEVLRGGASALYGDAAIGGVINVILRRPGMGSPRATISAGTHGSRAASADLPASLLGIPMAFSLATESGDGFRDHGQRRVSRARGRVDVWSRPDHRIQVAAQAASREFDEPGPLLESLMATDRARSDALFRFDHTRDRTYGFGFTSYRSSVAGHRLRSGIEVERRDLSAVRTLPLAPGFGDTRERELRTTRLLAHYQLDWVDSPLPGRDLLALGADVSIGWLDSRYFGVTSGDRAAYQAANGTRGALDAEGEGSRVAAAFFGHYAVALHDAVRLTLGGRLDLLRDAFRPEQPAGGDSTTARHIALSPKAGLNVRYLATPQTTGHLYVSISQSFKAPTPDQLFDQRPIPIPTPPFTVTTSNPDLDPQYGTSIETGIYHDLVIGDVRASATLALYQTDMRDELDFDVATLRYVNIGRSRHRGIEAGFTLAPMPSLALFTTHARQTATAERGPNAGRQLKAIPRHTLTAGATYTPGGPWRGTLLATRLDGMYLDDANTRRIPGWSRVDAQIGWQLGRQWLLLDVRNLLGAKYATTGFVDPAGTGEVYFHPAAGRHVALSLRHDW